MNSAVIGELDRIKKEAVDGLLHPEMVLEAARDTESPLHSRFEWNDAKAAEGYRLGQARTLIAAAIIMEPRLGEPVRAFVSLTSDRKAGGGYRSSGEVMDNAMLRRILLADAFRDIEVLARRHVALHELAPGFALFASLKAQHIQENTVTQPLAS